MEGSYYNIESKIIEFGRHQESCVLGVLGCCRNDAPEHLTDGPNSIAKNSFKGAIVFGAQRGDTQNSHSTLVQQLREHLKMVL